MVDCRGWCSCGEWAEDGRWIGGGSRVFVPQIGGSGWWFSGRLLWGRRLGWWRVGGGPW